MEMRLTGIILSKRNVGEADRLYQVYTREKGKVQLLAKGVRKVEARLAASLENFNLVGLTVVGRNGTKKITHALVEENFKRLRQDYLSLESVFRSLKKFEKIMEKEDRDQEAFQFVEDYLRSIEKTEAADETKISLLEQAFLFKVLSHLGYKFEITKCVRCGKKIVPGENYFDFSLGGLVCQLCPGNLAHCVKIGDNAVKALRIIYQNKLAAITRLKVSRKEINELKKVSEGYWRWIAK
jgi:DNA repair protein RecO (recombination protein O)